MIPVKAGTRNNGYFPEVRYSQGPQVMGETGDNSFNTLLGYLWMAVLDPAEGLRVFQAQVPGQGPWVLNDSSSLDVVIWNEVQVPPLPQPVSEVRHLAFCFDQSANHVVAYEYQGQVYLRQWNSESMAYAIQGPFPGVDPVLLWDYEVGYFLENSDVLLFHLSTDRTQAIMRVQSEQYGTPIEVATFSNTALLDQAIALPYQAEVLGSYMNSPDETGFALLTDPYPIYVGDSVGGLSITPPTSWTYTYVGSQNTSTGPSRPTY